MTTRPDMYFSPAPEPWRPTPLPAGPEHCACGVAIEPLRRTAGKCRACIAAHHTLKLMPAKPAPYPECAPEPAHKYERVRADASRHRALLPERPCTQCGQQYRSVYPQTMTCSDACRRKLQNTHAREYERRRARGKRVTA